MRHLRLDYDRIQDPDGRIGDDEPVWLLRAQDVAAPVAIRRWANFVEERAAVWVDGDTAETVAARVEEAARLASAARGWADHMVAWAAVNAAGGKVPDAPAGVLRPPSPPVEQAGVAALVQQVEELRRRLEDQAARHAEDLAQVQSDRDRTVEQLRARLVAAQAEIARLTPDPESDAAKAGA